MTTMLDTIIGIVATSRCLDLVLTTNIYCVTDPEETPKDMSYMIEVSG